MITASHHVTSPRTSPRGVRGLRSRPSYSTPVEEHQGLGQPTRSPTPSPFVPTLLTGSERRAENWCWRPRGSSSTLLVHTRLGRATVLTDGQAHEITTGDTVVWMPGAAQDFGGNSGDDAWEIVWAHYRPRTGWPDPLTWPLIGAGVARLAAPSDTQRQRIQDSLLEADTYARSNFHRGADLALNALERALLWLDSASPQVHQLDDRVQQAVMFIARHLDHDLSVPTIADHVHLSPSRLSHLFSQQVGTSPGRFVESRRIARAQELLVSSSLPIQEIATAAGFRSQFYFATRFKAVTGLSPSRWRGPTAPAGP